jgi:hypothetical protein
VFIKEALINPGLRPTAPWLNLPRMKNKPLCGRMTEGSVVPKEPPQNDLVFRLFFGELQGLNQELK